ncbi:choice-of-anchor A family protein [Viridibacterium curvum]|uniref:Choice-of-anchor A family protein n=1 Tax=Viridibacterium curvum TaxID=1101404 RepID=A0ABP9QIL2_9RHOO
MKFRSLIAAAVLACSSGAVFASSAFNLGVADNFSAFVFGNMTVTGSTDAEHSVAVQGNLTATSGAWTAAQGGATYSSGGKEWALVVGGNVNWTSGSVSDKTESVYVGGTMTTGSAYDPTLGPVQKGGTSPVDFAAVKAQLVAENAALLGKAATGTTLYGNNTATGGKAGGSASTLYLQGSGGAVEYFTIDSSRLTANIFNEFNLTGVAAGSTIVLNITGSATDIALSNMNSLLGFSGHQTLLNFASNVSKLTLGSLNADAAVLAYNADVTTTWGNENGTIIAKNYTGAAQLNGGHYGSSSSAASSSSSKVPEPGTLALAGLAMALIARRRRA